MMSNGGEGVNFC